MANQVLTAGKQGDQRYRRFTLQSAGTPVNLTTPKVTLYITGPGNSQTSVNTTDDTSVLVKIDSGANGVVELRPTSTMFSKPGDYVLLFRVATTPPRDYPSGAEDLTLRIHSGVSS